MFPVLFSLGSLTINSYSTFLVLGTVAALFVIWRLCLVYDLDKEKVIDIFLSMLLLGFIGARIAFVILYFDLFKANLINIFLFYRLPGLNFWGGFVFVIIFLLIISFRKKQQFWQVADLGIVGLFLALAFVSFGSFLSGYHYGFPSDLIFAVPQTNLPFKRFPIQLIESIIYFLVFLKLYSDSLKFHYIGAIISKGFCFLAVALFVFPFFYASAIKTHLFLTYGQIMAIFILIFGLYGIYKQGHRSLKADISAVFLILISFKRQKILLLHMLKWWYNTRVQTAYFLKRTLRRLARKTNVRTNPKQFN